ncbi:hypothetical protein [Nonomuraea dietziae]|uniref:hypothetical protein n=1 Tax=Nonomuraea dietziae TaxID=65515 RepID=UPI0031CDD9C9
MKPVQARTPPPRRDRHGGRGALPAAGRLRRRVRARAPATKAQGLTVKLPTYVPLAAAAKPDLPRHGGRACPRATSPIRRSCSGRWPSRPMSGGKGDHGVQDLPAASPRRASRTQRGRRSRSGSAARRTC